MSTPAVPTPTPAPAASTSGATPVVPATQVFRGIPAMPVITDFAPLMSTDGGMSAAVRRMNEQYNKYKFIESRDLQQRAALKQKIPDIARALEAVEFLQSRQANTEPISTHFELADHLFCRATVRQPQRVSIWLGANVMVEYSIEEALTLLRSNLTNAKQNLKSTEEELEFLKDQITTAEVNLARLHNHEVRLRKEQREAAQLNA